MNRNWNIEKSFASTSLYQLSCVCFPYSVKRTICNLWRNNTYYIFESIIIIIYVRTHHSIPLPRVASGRSGFPPHYISIASTLSLFMISCFHGQSDADVQDGAHYRSMFAKIYIYIYNFQIHADRIDLTQSPAAFIVRPALLTGSYNKQFTCPSFQELEQSITFLVQKNNTLQIKFYKHNYF